MLYVANSLALKRWVVTSFLARISLLVPTSFPSFGEITACQLMESPACDVTMAMITRYAKAIAVNANFNSPLASRPHPRRSERRERCPILSNRSPLYSVVQCTPIPLLPCLSTAGVILCQFNSFVSLVTRQRELKMQTVCLHMHFNCNYQRC